jgi:serine protease AprX
VVAPGVSIASLRNAGSYIDQNHPGAVVDSRFFRGSGTSQAAAVTSGAAALLLSAHPELTPDQVKSLLEATATPLALLDANAEGSGMINVDAASQAAPPLFSRQRWAPAGGLGSIEQARGGSHVALNGVDLTGEQDIMGSPWVPAVWAPSSAVGAAWSGGAWNGIDWAGASWGGTSWAGVATWSGRTWTGRTWTGQTWTGQTWTGQTWTGRTWTGQTWTGRTWTGRTWTGRTWTTPAA